MTIDDLIMSLALHPWTIYALFFLILCLFSCCVLYVVYKTMVDININMKPVSSSNTPHTLRDFIQRM